VLNGSSQVLLNDIVGKNNLKTWSETDTHYHLIYLFILEFDLLAIWVHKLMITNAFISPILNIHNCLLYEDDSVFFFKLAKRQFQIFKFLLLIFQRITGLTLNMKKKSKLVIMNIDDQQLNSHCLNSLNAKKNNFQFLISVYLHLQNH
jgi:hypothetical protein